MDPFAALSLACSVVQFVDFSTKLIAGASEIYESAAGMTKDDESLQRAVEEMRRLSSRLDSPINGQESDDERTLRRLAAECRNLSEQILELVQKSASRDPRSKRSGVRSAWKSRRNEKEKHALENKLGSCRSQLHLQLKIMTSSETKSKLTNIGEHAEASLDMLQSLQGHVEELRDGLQVTSFGPDAREQILSLLGLSESACRAAAQYHIRESLAFSCMRERYDAVEEAHKDTFRWFFEPDTGGESHCRQQAKQSFMAWLSSGSGIFHVSGKLGSGKSTFMKFIWNHSDTKSELQRWAGQHKLIIASFFFWKPARSRLQKSLSGLMRSLLHDTLQACPELTAVLFPEQWCQLMSARAHLHFGHGITFPDDEIQNAFAELTKHKETYKTHRFCFFIDGLDEYEESSQVDYKAMVELLRQWIAVAPNNVKLCVSSREYNVFQNAFSNEKRIRLQDLTQLDMEKYILAMLSDLEAGPEKEKLVTEILNRSDGIFLWVALVVKNLRERWEDGCSWFELRQELASLPRELKSLFNHLIESVYGPSCATAYKIFSMVYKLDTYNFKLPLHACSFLEDYQKDPLFALQAELPRANLDISQINAQNAETRKRINGRCKGLVDFVQIADDMNIQNLYLAFTHRSISEFFQEPNFQHKMATQLAGIIIEDVVCQILLADIRCRDSSCLSNLVASQYVSAIISMRTKLDLDLPPYRYLSCLDVAVTEKTGGAHSVGNDLLSFWRNPGGLSGTSKSPWSSPFYLSAYAGNLDFVAWMMESNPIMKDPSARGYLIICLSRRHPDQTQHVVLLNLMESLVDEYRTSTTTRNDRTLMFAWVTFLGSWTEFMVRTANFTPTSSLHMSTFGKLMELFLRAGVDPRVSFEMLFGTVLRTNTSSTRFPKMEILFTAPISEGPHSDFYQVGFVRLFDKGMLLSFRNMVGYWNLSNEKEIFELIDERTKLYESEQDDDQDTEDPQRLAVEAPQERETAGINVVRLSESNSPPEASETEVMAATPKLGATHQGWYTVSGFGYAVIILMGLLLAFILPQLFAIIPWRNAIF